MTVIQAKLKWLGGRLETRARDLRQAEQSARSFDPVGYPYAQRLADVHAHAAELYERAVEIVREELSETCLHKNRAIEINTMPAHYTCTDCGAAWTERAEGW